MHVLILRPYRKDNIYFRTIEEREKINRFITSRICSVINRIMFDDELLSYFIMQFSYFEKSGEKVDLNSFFQQSPSCLSC